MIFNYNNGRLNETSQLKDHRMTFAIVRHIPKEFPEGRRKLCVSNSKQIFDLTTYLSEESVYKSRKSP